MRLINTSRHLTFDIWPDSLWTIFYWYSLQDTDKFVDFSWHLIYDLWRNKETNRKFSFWVGIKWKSKNFAMFGFSKVAFSISASTSCRLQSPVLPSACTPLHPSTNVEQILSGDQKIWSSKLAAQKRTRAYRWIHFKPFNLVFPSMIRLFFKSKVHDIAWRVKIRNIPLGIEYVSAVREVIEGNNVFP